MKRILSSFLCLVMVFMLAACTSQEPTEPSAEGSAEPVATLTQLNIGLDNDPTTLDPWAATDTLAITIINTIYEGLLGYDANRNIIPVLAEEMPEVNEDATVFTFHLRKGVKFHDGTELTADAVKMTFERALNPDNALSRRSVIASIDTIDVLDDYTVRLNLQSPNSNFINALAFGCSAIISPTLLESGENIGLKPCGTGPYTFTEWMDGDHVLVTRNENYWNQNKLAQFSSINFLPRPEASTRIAGLQTGELDAIYPVPSDQFDLLSTYDGIDTEVVDGTLVLFFEMNNQREPFNDVRVRQAFNYAFDNEAFVRVVENGFGKVAESCMSASGWGFKKQQMYDYNPEKAKELLAEAGYPDGFACTLYINTTSKSQKMAEFLQQQLALINVDLTIASYEKAVMNEICSADPAESVHDLRCGGWGPSIADAYWAMRNTLNTAAWSNKGGSNYSYYSNEYLDDLMQSSLSVSDQDELRAIYDEAQQIVVSEAPWIFVDTPGLLWAKSSKIGGLALSPSGRMVFNDAYRIAD